MENNEKMLKELVSKLLEYRAALSNISMAESGEGVEAEYWLQKFDKTFGGIILEIFSKDGK